MTHATSPLVRYFYLICFASYAMEHGPSGFKSSFQAWMDQRAHLRTMIAEGKDKLEWYRQVKDHFNEILRS